MKNIRAMCLSLVMMFMISTSCFANSRVSVDGSSTVFLITEAVAEEFQKANSGIQVTVGISGTGGGFKKFGAREIDICDASRPIKKTEVELCTKNGISYVELPVAFDAIAVVVNPKNTWCKSITVAELKKIWEPEAQGKITRWSQIREGWPDQPIRLYGPGVDSGTYDYFTGAIVGKEHSSRGDFTSSEDDNILVRGVSSDPNALGFFGLAYYTENKAKLKVVPVDGGAGPQLPNEKNVIKGIYQPLSRPLFIYVSTASLNKAEVLTFCRFYIANCPKLSKEVGYVPLPGNVYKLVMKRLENKKTGSIFGGGGSQVGVKLSDLLKKESK